MTVTLAKRIWQLRTVAAALLLPPLLLLTSFELLAARLSRAGPAGPAPVPDDDSLAWWVDVLLRRRALLTGFQYFTHFGVSYTFGSIYNNVVNPRF